MQGSRWSWAVLPVNAGVTGFNTMLPLYVLQLGGTVVAVAIITTIYNLMFIPSSIFWGSITDRLSRRRLFFLVSYLGSAAIFLGMLMIPHLAWLAFLYGWLAFVVVANSAASNLLVMETTAKRSWVRGYANLSLIANLGSVVGLVAGVFWSSVLPLEGFLAFCAASAAVSLFLSFWLVREPSIPLETLHLAFHPQAFLSRMTHTATYTRHVITSMVMAPPSPRELARIIRTIRRGGGMHGRQLLFLSTFFFMVGSALLNTSFTPYLADRGVLFNEVFAISLVNVVIATLSYRSIGFFTSRLGEARAGPYAIVLRTGLYAALAASALALGGFGLFLFATVFYALIGVVYAIWNSSTSVILFSNLGAGRQGSLLGGYSALSGLGLVIGSFFSGYISYYAGYAATFTTAAAALLVSFFVLQASFRDLGIGRPPR